MQHFTTTEMDLIEKYLNAKFCNDLPGNTINHLHCHSDNAGQHFKNTGALEFFRHLKRLWGGAGKCSYVYSFEALGHGKGVYDGLGGSMKTKVHILIQWSKTGQAIPRMQSGYINNVKKSMMHCGITFNLIMHQYANSIGTLLICMYSLSMLAITIQFDAGKKSIRGWTRSAQAIDLL
jgi:hypothetical protein